MTASSAGDPLRMNRYRVCAKRSELCRPDEREPSPGEERQQEQSAQDRLPRRGRQEVTLWHEPLLGTPEVCQQREYTDGGDDRERNAQQRYGGGPDSEPVADVGDCPSQHHEREAREEFREAEELLPATVERDEANAHEALFNCQPVFLFAFAASVVGNSGTPIFFDCVLYLVSRPSALSRQTREVNYRPWITASNMLV